MTKISSVFTNKDNTEFVFHRGSESRAYKSVTTSSSMRWIKFFIKENGKLLLPYKISDLGGCFEFRVQPEGQRKITSVIIPSYDFSTCVLEIVRNNAMMQSKCYKRITLSSFVRIASLLDSLCKQGKAKNRIHDTFYYGKPASITKIEREERYEYDF